MLCDGLREYRSGVQGLDKYSELRSIGSIERGVQGVRGVRELEGAKYRELKENRELEEYKE